MSHSSVSLRFPKAPASFPKLGLHFSGDCQGCFPTEALFVEVVADGLSVSEMMKLLDQARVGVFKTPE